jgi:hypothetical protein
MAKMACVHNVVMSGYYYEKKVETVMLINFNNINKGTTTCHLKLLNTKKITVNGITNPPLDSKGSRLMGSQLHLLIVKDHG